MTIAITIIIVILSRTNLWINDKINDNGEESVKSRVPIGWEMLDPLPLATGACSRATRAVCNQYEKSNL